jgi:hypothetical protein
MAVGFFEVVNEALDLVEEVELLRGRLEAVSELVRDPAESGEDVEAWRVVEALRGE